MNFTSIGSRLCFLALATRETQILAQNLMLYCKITEENLRIHNQGTYVSFSFNYFEGAAHI